MSDGVKLDKPVTRLDQVRFEEQLKERGIEDKNGDGHITTDEIDSDRVSGGLDEVKRAAGPDGLLQPSEVAGVNISRGVVETVKHALGLTKENSATKSVKEATKEIREAIEQLQTLRTFETVREFVGAVEELNEAGEAIREQATRTDIGLADKATAEEMRDALKELSRAVDILNGADFEAPRISRSFYNELMKLNSTLEALHSVATETFGLSFPRIEMSFTRLEE